LICGVVGDDGRIDTGGDDAVDDDDDTAKGFACAAD
jgi:hypothetical protein